MSYRNQEFHFNDPTEVTFWLIGLSRLSRFMYARRMTCLENREKPKKQKVSQWNTYSSQTKYDNNLNLSAIFSTPVVDLQLPVLLFTVYSHKLITNAITIIWLEPLISTVTQLCPKIPSIIQVPSRTTRMNINKWQKEITKISFSVPLCYIIVYVRMSIQKFSHLTCLKQSFTISSAKLITKKDSQASGKAFMQNAAYHCKYENHYQTSNYHRYSIEQKGTIQTNKSTKQHTIKSAVPFLHLRRDK